MSKKGKQYYQIWLFLEGGGKIKKVRISKNFSKIILGTLITLIATFFISSGVFIWGLPRIKGYSELKKKEMKYQEIIRNSLVHIDEIYNHLSNLKLLEKKIRIATNIEPSGEPVAGVGGTLPEEMDKVPDGGEMFAYKLEVELSSLKKEIINTEGAYQNLLPSLEEREKYMKSIPLLWPVRGWVTSEFGFRYMPMFETHKFHQGIDIATRIGTSIIAPANGMVTFAGWEGTYGKTIVIDHGYGIVTRYAHLSEIYVNMGKEVKRGEIIGTVGDTGITTGPHLHYEVIVNGVPVNPRDYMVD